MDENNTNKKSNKSFIIKYAVFCIVLFIITTVLIYFSITNINNSYHEDDSIITSISSDTPKKIAEDSKYAIKSYDETYDQNALKLTYYHDVNGVITDSMENIDYSTVNTDIEFVQIEGLKNTNIQKEINKKLKEKAYSFQYKDLVNCNVTANFANILSVWYLSNAPYHPVYDCLNFDLTTGKELKLEDLFVSSAPINSYLANGLYEALAWNDDVDEDLYAYGEKDMTNADTSDYENKFIMLINKYHKVKDNLKFCVYPNSIQIYGLIDKTIFNSNDLEYISLSINLINCIDEVAMYKKYLTNESIYVDNSIGEKNIIVFTSREMPQENFITYGKLQNNIFMEEMLIDYNYENKSEQLDKTIKDFIKSLSDDKKADLINNNTKSKGTFFQRKYSLYAHYEYDGYSYNPDYFNLSVYSCQTNCSIDYFKNEAFLDFIKLKAMPGGGDVDLFTFSDDYYTKNLFPHLNILPSKEENYYFDLNGEFIGNTEEEAKAKLEEIKLKELEPTITPTPTPLVTPTLVSSPSPTAAVSHTSSNNASPTEAPVVSPTPNVQENKDSNTINE